MLPWKRPSLIRSRLWDSVAQTDRACYPICGQVSPTRSAARKRPRSTPPRTSTLSAVCALLADDAVVVAVVHVRVRRMPAMDGRDPVPARLGARDAAVVVVVVEIEGARVRRRRVLRGDRTRRRGGRLRPDSSITMAVDSHPARTRLNVSRSRSSTVSEYVRRTSTTRAAYQQRLVPGSQSAASLSDFSARLTDGLASVRFRRSDAKRSRVAASAAHRPLSCASERATMCSMSVSAVLANHVPV